ncbi:hypothetical protein Tco_0033229 [Tanacetum coccineum]
MLRGIMTCKEFGHSLQSISRSSTNLQQQTFVLLPKSRNRLKIIPHQGETVGSHGLNTVFHAAEQSDWLGTRMKRLYEQNWKHITKDHGKDSENVSDERVVALWEEANSALGEAISCRDSCLIALQNKQNEFEKYKAFNDRTIDYEILQTKLNETLGLLALKDIEIKEGLKTKAYEISVLNQKHDELVKKSLLTRSQLEGYLKENTKVISDLKVKEDKDIDKMIEMDKQLKFLNEIVYTRNQSIQTIHMLAPKCSTYNGRPTFANPRYLKKAQSEKPCLYEIPYDTSYPANRFAPDREETMTQ